MPDNHELGAILEAYKRFLLQENDDELGLSYPKNVALKAIQDFYRNMILEAIGEDEEQVLPDPKKDNYDAVQRCVGRNQLRQQLRQNITAQFKGDSDVVL